MLLFSKVNKGPLERKDIGHTGMREETVRFQMEKNFSLHRKVDTVYDCNFYIGEDIV
jgi:hypothetical protein